jgi:Tfp pilus assembly protein PilO
MAFDIKSIDIKDKKTQIMILAGLLAVLGVVIYLSFILKPQVFRVMEAVSGAGSISADLREAEKNIADIPVFKKSMEANEEKVGRYEKMLPAEQEIPSILENLSSIAKSSNIKIVGIIPVDVKDDKSKNPQVYQEIPILINAKSGYHELGKFLSSIENSDRFMKVADIQIRANAQSPKKHDVEILVLTYILLRGK